MIKALAIAQQVISFVFSALRHIKKLKGKDEINVLVFIGGKLCIIPAEEAFAYQELMKVKPEMNFQGHDFHEFYNKNKAKSDFFSIHDASFLYSLDIPESEGIKASRVNLFLTAKNEINE